MKPELPVCSKTGKPADFGPFEVAIESPDVNTTVEFNDLPSEARFPYAIDRASRYANQMRRAYPLAAVSITAPSGEVYVFPPARPLT